MDFVSRLANFLGYWSLQAAGFSVSNSNWVFALQCKYTSIALIICSSFVAIHQFVFNPINCNSNRDSLSGLDTSCWMRKSFQKLFAYSEEEGIQINSGSDPYPSYYQWVYFVLLVQAVAFYLPGHFWQAHEGGRLKKLVLALDSPALSEEVKSMNTALILQHLLASKWNNRWYFFHFVVAEVWNFINVVGQIYFVDYASGKAFSTYGLKVIAFTEWESYERYDPLANIFPRMIVCTLPIISSSRDIMQSKVRCVLPINEVSEKICILLWLWFCILAILSGVTLIFRLATVASSKVRFLATISRFTACDPYLLQSVINNLGLGDWFVLDLLAKNVDPQHFKDIVYHLEKKLDR